VLPPPTLVVAYCYEGATLLLVGIPVSILATTLNSAPVKAWTLAAGVAALILTAWGFLFLTVAEVRRHGRGDTDLDNHGPEVAPVPAPAPVAPASVRSTVPAEPARPPEPLSAAKAPPPPEMATEPAPVRSSQFGLKEERQRAALRNRDPLAWLFRRRSYPSDTQAWLVVLVAGWLVLGWMFQVHSIFLTGGLAIAIAWRSVGFLRTEAENGAMEMLQVTPAAKDLSGVVARALTREMGPALAVHAVACGWAATGDDPTHLFWDDPTHLFLLPGLFGGVLVSLWLGPWCTWRVRSLLLGRIAVLTLAYPLPLMAVALVLQLSERMLRDLPRYSEWGPWLAYGWFLALQGLLALLAAWRVRVNLRQTHRRKPADPR
jgi:hypothetical protein